MYWLRHGLMVLICILLPFGAALYFDTSSEVNRSLEGGATRARVARNGLDGQLRVVAGRLTNDAAKLARSIGASPLKPEQIKTAIGADAPKGAVVWVVDESGRVVYASSGPSDFGVGGHPIFEKTQWGYALDGIWRSGSAVSMVGAAPIGVRGEARGAVFVRQPFKRSFLSEVVEAIAADVTLVNEGEVLTTTLETTDVAEKIAKDAVEAATPIARGRLEKPLPSRVAAFPIFVDSHADGLAYSSLAMPVHGLPGASWIVSADATQGLVGLAARQESIVGGLIFAIGVALLVGLMNHRSFVRPIAQLEEFLHSVQTKGEREILESALAGPFRRVAKQLNMILPKLPAKGVSSTLPAASNAALVEETLADEELAAVSMLRGEEGDVPSPENAEEEIAAAIASLEASTDLGEAMGGASADVVSSADLGVLAAVPEPVTASSPPQVGTEPLTEGQDRTAIVTVPQELLDASMQDTAENDGLDNEDRAHFQEVFDKFVALRERCGESTDDLAAGRFMEKLTRNRDDLVKKYQCRTVRFQVYEKNGRAALKASPVRAR